MRAFADDTALAKETAVAPLIPFATAGAPDAELVVPCQINALTLLIATAAISAGTEFPELPVTADGSAPDRTDHH